MGLRAGMCEERLTLPGHVSGRVLRASMVLAGVLGAVLMASPASGQRAVSGSALVQVPPVSQLDVETRERAVPAGTDTRAGVFRVKVRANHGWKVLLAASPSMGGEIRVRDPETGEYRRLEAGLETVIASGDRGEVILEVEYRWDPASPEAGASLPLTYTLASQ